MVPADSQHIPRVRCYSGTPSATCVSVFAYGALTLYGNPSQKSSTNTTHTTWSSAEPQRRRPTTPQPQPLPGITRSWFSLIRFRSPLLTESQLFSLPVGTEMFHFPTFPPTPYFIQVWVTRHDTCQVTPFGHPRITARLTTPRGLSRPPTSFIGS